MWRMGLSDDKTRQNTSKKSENNKAKPAKRNVETHEDPKMIAPVFDRDSQVTNGRDRKGSILAAEHLMIRRSLRGSRLFNQSQFTTFQNRDSFPAGTMPLEHSRPGSKNTPRLSITSKISKVQEIQKRVNQAVTDFENVSDDDVTDEIDLMQDIEQNLHVIEDDMLRINVVLLMDKFRKANQQLKDDQSWNRQNDTNQNKDLLESLQNWMDEDHFDDFDDLEPGSNHSITNSNAINDHLDHIQANIQKVESLNEKIKQLKQYGTDTAHLERQRKNLQWQVKQDVLDNDYKRRHGGEADSSNKQEFNYLKNAASEIYNLLNRTRVEGMAHSHQFEEELKKILQQMEDKEKDVEYLESRLEQQKRVTI
ncbi:unnamed protein product [Clavelina lepadiformis]|uniref:Uncharacterized protein n=1 Tax=Clavelina lepadiformis TaxID=159417 RepID=A0ABP0FI73_CLALP